jgi:hypothetical protein
MLLFWEVQAISRKSYGVLGVTHMMCMCAGCDAQHSIASTSSVASPWTLGNRHVLEDRVAAAVSTLLLHLKQQLEALYGCSMLAVFYLFLHLVISKPAC